MKLAVAIATAGRRSELAETIGFLRKQTRLPDSIYICPASQDDIEPGCLIDFPCPVHVVSGSRGSAAQRNTILRHVDDEDLILFLDDDYLPALDYFQELDNLFSSCSDLAVATGHVVADGANGPGISFEAASKIIGDLPPQLATPPREIYGAYGCNMAVRTSAIVASGVLFDENLPLYGWWEDIDFSRRARPFGKVVRSQRLRGVHRGVKRARSSGQRVGYSQVANVLYLIKKGSVTKPTALKQIGKNVVANVVGQIRPEPWIDRRGRVRGNVLAVVDALRGVVNPARILTLD